MYLAVLKLAADEGEGLVDRALQALADRHEVLSYDLVVVEVAGLRTQPRHGEEVLIAPVDVSIYDELLENQEVAHAAGL